MRNDIIVHTFEGIVIQQRQTDGYLNATAMCKACGKFFNDYFRLSSTKEFLTELSGSTGIPVDLLVQMITTGPNESRGTWVEPHVSIHLAQWLSPKFAVQVSFWIIDWFKISVNPMQVTIVPDVVTCETCGSLLHIQPHPVDAVQLAVELGLKSSISRDGREFVTVKDLATFAGVKLSKIRYYAKKHREHLNPIALNRWERQALGGRATHLKAYPLDEAVRVILAMDSVTGIELKDKLFGAVGILAKPDTREEIQWAAKLSTAFDGQDFHHNFPLGSYRVDFFIGSFKVVLECNGFEHRYYNAEKERIREQFITRDYGLIRFDHTVSWEKLIKAILRVKPGEIIRLFNRDISPRMVV